MMETSDLIAELQDTKCRCGNQKARGNTFCSGCYYQLPPEMRRALYQRIGEGYEEAYENAAAVLRTG